MNNIFSKEGTQLIINRIKKLAPDSKPLWGKMSVSQMIAHCNVSYEMVYEDIHKKPNSFMKIILKLFVKNKVVNDKPYSKNSPTAPQFIVNNERSFEEEKTRLIIILLKLKS